MRRVTIVVVALAFTCIRCNDGPGTRVNLPTVAPTPVAPPPPSAPSIRVFTDPMSGVTTSDVHDAQDQVFQLNSAGQVIWKADGGVYSFAVRGAEEGLVVRFGAKNAERRAYLIYDMEWYHYGPPEVVVDLEVVDGKLIVSTASPPVPLTGS
jgi:hypothetical protein